MAFAQDDDVPSPPGKGLGRGRGAGQGSGLGYGQGSGLGNSQGYGRGMMGNAWWMDSVAQALGMTTEEVWSELTTGKSIADLAAEQGVDIEGLIEDILAEHEAFLNEAVAAGNITEDQKDWMQANMAAMLSARINDAWTFGGYGGGFGHGMGRGGYGRKGGGCHSGLYLGRSWSS